MFKSTLFLAAVAKTERATDAALDLPLFGLLYMLVVLPLGLLLMLLLMVCAMPGLFVHGLVWARVDVDAAGESMKVSHDVSLLVLALASAVLMFWFVMPHVLPAAVDDPRCSTHPYC